MEFNHNINAETYVISMCRVPHEELKIAIVYNCRYVTFAAITIVFEVLIYSYYYLILR